MKEKIDALSPITIFAFVSAFIGDFAFILALGVLIPIIGLVFLALFLAFHYVMGAISTAILWHKTHGWLAKLTLLLALFIPLPLLCIGIVLAIILSNKLLAFLAQQAIILALTPETGGAALAIGEEIELAAAGTEAGGEAVLAGRAAQAARAAQTSEEAAAAGARAGTEEAEGGGARAVGAGAREKAAVPEETPAPMEELKEELVGEEPPETPFDRAKKMKDRLAGQGQQQEEEEEDEEEGEEETEAG